MLLAVLPSPEPPRAPEVRAHGAGNPRSRPVGSEERPVDGGAACAPVPAPLRPAVSFPAPARSWHSGAAENAEPMSMWKPSLKGAGRRPRALPLGPPGAGLPPSYPPRANTA